VPRTPEFHALVHGEDRTHPTEIECGWRVVTSEGERMLVTETCGSPSRKTPGKTSQSIQFDASAASELMRILKVAFPTVSNADGRVKSVHEQWTCSAPQPEAKLRQFRASDLQILPAPLSSAA
jgi:hypothetical protein